jgi:1,4-alpha-glucan branching enzyme
VSAYDTELFGHWWFEGLVWLKEVLRLLETGDGEVFSCTAKEYLAAYPPDEALALPESSWGAGGGHYTWRNAENEWMWPLIENAERKMEKLVAAYPEADGDWVRFLNQAAREALLLESSDWPFLISTGQAVGYAIQRFQSHLDRFDRLSLILDYGSYSLTDLSWLSEIEYEDNPFPFVDYRSFARREGAMKPPA